MSVALFIVPERETPGLDTFVNGKALGRVRPRLLDRLAARAGVRPLMEFFSEDPAAVEAFLRDEGVDPPEGGFEPERWFPAGDGLVTVRGLLAALAAEPTAVPDAPAVVEDLREFESVLARLDQEHVDWHLAVDS